MKKVKETVKDTKKEQQSVEAPQAALIIHNQYIKDFSLEIPFAPAIFKELKQAPSMHVDISMNKQDLEDANTYNISLTTKMDGDLGDKKVFIIELTYSAIVTLNVPQEHLEPIMFIEIPRLLFPYVRSIISNSMSQAGLPPVMISPIDFAAMYQARKAKEAAAANA